MNVKIYKISRLKYMSQYAENKTVLFKFQFFIYICNNMNSYKYLQSNHNLLSLWQLYLALKNYKTRFSTEKFYKIDQ